MLYKTVKPYFPVSQKIKMLSCSSCRCGWQFCDWKGEFNVWCAIKAVPLQTSVQIDPIHKPLLDSEVFALICLTWWDLKQLSVLLLDVCFRSCTLVFACSLKCEISPKIYLTVLKSIGLQSSWSLIPLEMGVYWLSKWMRSFGFWHCITLTSLTLKS